MTDTRATYQTSKKDARPQLRPGTLAKFSDPTYTPPEPEEFTSVIQHAGLSSADAGNLLGIDSRTTRRYKSGERSIPYAVWRLLLIETGIAK